MKRLSAVLLISLFAITMAFAAPEIGLEAGIGLTPGIGVSMDINNFSFEVEGTLIGGHVSATYDVLPSEDFDLNIGLGAGATFNPLVNLLVAIFSLGYADDVIFCEAELMVRFAYNFGDHSSLFAQYGFPVVVANWSNEEGLVSPVYFFKDLDSLGTCAGMGLLNTFRVGYRFTF